MAVSGAVRAVNDIPFNGGCELFPQGARLGFGGVGGSHQFTQTLDGVLGFQSHHDDPARAHKIGQAAEKFLVAVDRIEALRLPSC